MEIITTHPFIDEILNTYRNELGQDYDKYSNHVFRTYHLALALLGPNPKQTDKDKIALAAAFHDLGIWTAQTFDYLAPSIQLAKQYLEVTQLSDWTTEIALMIDFHHKRSRYKGDFEKTVEAFRKADWIEVTLGLKQFGVDKTFIKQLKKAFPNQGFHWFLTKQTVKQFLKHPSNPLPMFKK